MKIEFKKIEAAAPISGGGNRKIYDYQIHVDGEHRATWIRDRINGQGYSLRPQTNFPAQHLCYPKPAGAPAHVQPKRIICRALDEMEPVTKRLLEDGLIPTMAQIAEMNAANIQKNEQAKAAARLEAIDAAKYHAGPKLYDTLKEIIEAGSLRHGDADTALSQMRRLAVEAVAEVAARFPDAEK